MDETAIAQLRFELEEAREALQRIEATASFDTSEEENAARALVEERARALVLAEAQFAQETREEQGRALLRTLEANERMAQASADAARWAKWAALGTAVAAAIAALQTFLE
jgi:hypothetical protein